MEKIYFKLERVHLCAPMSVINFAIDIDGHIKRETLINAIMVLEKIHPTLNSTVTIDSEGKAYLDLTKDLNPELIWLEEIDDLSVEEIVKLYDKKPFDVENGPLIRFVLINKGNSFTLLINGHHILGDGLSYLTIIHDLIDVLNGTLRCGEKNGIAKIPTLLNSHQLFIDQNHADTSIENLANDLNGLWSVDKHSFSSKDYIKMFEAFHKENDSAIYLGFMAPEKFKRLNDYCHSNGVTINDALTTAFLKATSEVLIKYENKPLRIGMAINIRGDLKYIQNEAIGNYISGIIVNPQYQKDETFIENTHRVSDQIHSLANNPSSRLQAADILLDMDDGLLDAFLFAAYSDYSSAAANTLAKILGEGQPTSGIGITNLGENKLKFSNNEYCVNNITFINPASPSNDITVGAIGYNGGLNLCLRYYSNLYSDDKIKQICDNALEILTV